MVSAARAAVRGSADATRAPTAQGSAPPCPRKPRQVSTFHGRAVYAVRY